MTFSICVREPYRDDDGDPQVRFGVAVTTRLPGVGTLCPFASEHGAVATQSLVNVELGRKGVEYLDDGLAVEDALQALLNADDGAAGRQLHGVDREGTFAFSGEECREWYGHDSGDNYTVAGNLLTGESVIAATADAYAGSFEWVAVDGNAATGEANGEGSGAVRADDGGGGNDGNGEDGSDTDGDDDGGSEDRGDDADAIGARVPPAAYERVVEADAPLAERLIDALAAGHAEGGDKREKLHVQSAALLVRTTERRAVDPYYDDLRVDATETPLADLRETYDLAVEGYEATLQRYADDAE